MPPKRSSEQDDFNITAVISSHTSNITDLQDRITKLENRVKGSVEFGKSFQLATQESQHIIKALDTYLYEFLKDNKSKTRTAFKSIFKEIAKDNTLFKLGQAGQWLITLILTVVSGAIGAWLSKVLGLK